MVKLIEKTKIAFSFKTYSGRRDCNIVMDFPG